MAAVTIHRAITGPPQACVLVHQIPTKWGVSEGLVLPKDIKTGGTIQRNMMRAEVVVASASVHICRWF